MNDDPEQLDQYVEDLLQDRRPERTPLADQDALGARQTAAMLRATKPGAGLPSNEFLGRMQASIGEWVRERSPEAHRRLQELVHRQDRPQLDGVVPPASPPGWRRRSGSIASRRRRRPCRPVKSLSRRGPGKR